MKKITTDFKRTSLSSSGAIGPTPYGGEYSESGHLNVEVQNEKG